jgi:hypothetical protein
MLTDSLFLIMLNESTLLKECAGSATWHSHRESLAEDTQQAVSLNIILGRSESMKKKLNDLALLAILELLVLTLEVMEVRDSVNVAISKFVEQPSGHWEVQMQFSRGNIPFIDLHRVGRRVLIHKGTKEATLLVKSEKELPLTEDSSRDELEKAEF